MEESGAPSAEGAGPVGPTTAEDGTAPERHHSGPEKVSLFPVLFWVLGTLPLAAASPYLLLLLLLPLAAAVWVLRASVVAAPAGIGVCNGLVTTRLPWSEVEGFTVPRRGAVRLLRHGGRPLGMTALPRRELPLVLAVADRAARAQREAARRERDVPPSSDASA